MTSLPTWSGLLPLNGNEVLWGSYPMLNPGGMDGFALAMRDGPQTAVADRAPHGSVPLHPSASLLSYRTAHLLVIRGLISTSSERGSFVAG